MLQKIKNFFQGKKPTRTLQLGLALMNGFAPRLQHNFSRNVMPMPDGTVATSTLHTWTWFKFVASLNSVQVTDARQNVQLLVPGPIPSRLVDARGGMLHK